MRLSICKLVAFIGVAGMLAGSVANAAETQEQRDARMKWWREAKFGMFIHYGIYSGLAGYIENNKYNSAAEWIQSHSNFDTNRYAKAGLPLFKPQKGCTEAWVQLAKEAGCKYAVLTTKHHEGFAIYDTKVSDFNSVKTNQIDIVREFTDSCHKNGMKVGYYHSVIDWHHPDYGWKEAEGLPYPEGNKALYKNPDHSKYQKFLHAQVDELISNYGEVDILWWDYSSPQFKGEKAWKAPELIEKIRAKQPGIIMNNRLYHMFSNKSGPLVVTKESEGDFSTPEQHVPDEGIPGDWEVCMTLNNTWGYSSYDNNWKSDETLIRRLVDTVSRGGNFLLNIGPKPDGSIPEETLKSFKAIGQWMKVNGDAIYGTKANPFGHSFPWGVATSKGDDIYLIMYLIPESKMLKLPFEGEGKIKAHALNNPSAQLPVRQNEDGLTIDMTKVKAFPLATVVKLSGRGKVLKGIGFSKGKFELNAETAKLADPQKIEKKEGKANIGSWTDISPVSWDLRKVLPGSYNVSVTYACRDISSGTPVEISANGSGTSLKWTVAGTGKNWDTFKTENIGKIKLSGGDCTLTFKPLQKPKEGVANIRQIVLTPVK